MDITPNPASILIVDDTPTNLEILTQMVTRRGYRPRPGLSGKRALIAAEHETPDLILLDINMPDMDGVQTCRKFKENEVFRDIPIIFVSGRTETSDKLAAFREGGVDYITKPFDAAEVIARIDTHLELRRLQIELRRSYQDLQRLEELRDNLVHMFAHDMRTPLSVMQMSLKMLKDEIGNDLVEDNRLDLDDAVHGSESLIQMINDLLDVSRMESGKMPIKRRTSNVVGIVREAIKHVRKLAEEIKLSLETEHEEVLVECDPEIIDRVISNFLHNALKFTPAGGSVSVMISKMEGFIEISFTDTGSGIPEEFLEQIFDKFGHTEEAKQYTSSGLGLTFCKMAVESHQGEVGVGSEVGRGSRFWFTLPDKRMAASQ